MIVFVYTSVNLEASGPWGHKESDTTEHHHHNTRVNKLSISSKASNPPRGGIWGGFY